MFGQCSTIHNSCSLFGSTTQARPNFTIQFFSLYSVSLFLSRNFCLSHLLSPWMLLSLAIVIPPLLIQMKKSHPFHSHLFGTGVAGHLIRNHVHMCVSARLCMHSTAHAYIFQFRLYNFCCCCWIQKTRAKTLSTCWSLHSLGPSSTQIDRQYIILIHHIHNEFISSSSCSFSLCFSDCFIWLFVCRDDVNRSHE